MGATGITASKDGVTSNTASLDVTPPSSTDTVVITKATYNAKKDKLDVVATSSLGGDPPTLTATAYDSALNVMGSVVMAYNSKKDKHEGEITGLASKPATVVVTSSGGGSASIEGSAIGGNGG